MEKGNGREQQLRYSDGGFSDDSGGGRSGSPEKGADLEASSSRGGDMGHERGDPEVLERPQRRRFSAEYKARIVQEADSCTEAGQIGALLRREGLYSSYLASWRRSYRRGAKAALTDNKRGRKQQFSPVEKENERLRKQMTHLERRLERAEAIIEIQKKISMIAGIPLKEIESEESE